MLWEELPGTEGMELKSPSLGGSGLACAKGVDWFCPTTRLQHPFKYGTVDENLEPEATLGSAVS